MKTGRKRSRLLYWLPLLAAAPLGGWLLLPAKPLASAAVPAASPAPSNSPPQTNPNAPRGVGGITGQVLFEQECAVCHGQNGQGTARSQYVSLKGVGEADIDFQLTTGRMPMKDTALRLPPYRPVLPGADIKALDYFISNYISKGGTPIPTVDPAAGDLGHGGELYRENCAACHAWSGAGGVLFNTFVPRLTYATPTQVAEAIRIGPAQMPVFGPNQISQDQLNAIVAYVTRDLEHPHDKDQPLSHLGPVAEGLVIMAIALPLILMFMRWVGQRG